MDLSKSASIVLATERASLTLIGASLMVVTLARDFICRQTILLLMYVVFSCILLLETMSI